MQSVPVEVRWNDSDVPVVCPVTGATHTPYIGNYPFLRGTARPVLMRAISDSSPETARQIEGLALNKPALLSLNVLVDDEWIVRMVLYSDAEDTSGCGMDGFWDATTQSWGALFQATRYSLLQVGEMQGMPLPCSVRAHGHDGAARFVRAFADTLDTLFRYHILVEAGYRIGKADVFPGRWRWVSPAGRLSALCDTPDSALEYAWADASSKADPCFDVTVR
jgi:hypothetical protein